MFLDLLQIRLSRWSLLFILLFYFLIVCKSFYMNMVLHVPYG